MNPKHHHKIRTLALCLAALPAAAFAEDGNTATELENITVTAKNRSLKTENRNSYGVGALRSTTGLVLSPREVPQSVTVLTKKQLEDQGITRLEDALKTATGINVFKSGTRTHFMSRGYFIEQIEEDGIAAQTGSPGGFGLGGPSGDPTTATDLAMYDRVEIVRGAAGLTQANNEPGGTVNLVRKKPTVQTQISADLLADRFGKINGVFDASGTLSPENGLRGRFVGSVTRNKTFQEGSHGRDYMLYGILEKDIGDTGKLTLSASHLDQMSRPDPDGLPLFADGSGFERKRYLGADWNTERQKKDTLFAEYEHYFNDNWKLDSKLDWRKTRGYKEYYTLGGGNRGIGADNLAGNNSFDRYDSSSRLFTFQNNLTGRFQAFGRSHDIFFAHTFAQEKDTSLNRWPASDRRKFNVNTFNGSEIAKPDWDAAGNSARGGEGRYKTHSFGAGFRINPLDNLHIIVGGRYTRWYRALDWDRNLKDRTPATTQELKRNRFVPYAGITFDLTPNQSLYAAYTSIFKQTMNRRADDSLLPPIMGKNYEIGWKGTWNGGRLNTSLAAYLTDKDNNNQRVNPPAGSGRQAYWTSLDQRSKGVEAEISGSITDRWNIFAGYTFNRSTNRNTIQENIASRQAGYNFSSHTPKHMFRLYTSYTLPFDSDKWTVGLGINSSSKSSTSGGTIRQGGYTVWNANLQYRPTKQIQLSLAVNNLTDKRYYANQYSRSFNSGNFYGEPRNVLLGFKWKM
jgi:tonB-dependent siderophore receptor